MKGDRERKRGINLRELCSGIGVEICVLEQWAGVVNCSFRFRMKNVSVSKGGVVMKTGKLGWKVN